MAGSHAPLIRQANVQVILLPWKNGFEAANFKLANFQSRYCFLSRPISIKRSLQSIYRKSPNLRKEKKSARLFIFRLNNLPLHPPQGIFISPGKTLWSGRNLHSASNNDEDLVQRCLQQWNDAWTSKEVCFEYSFEGTLWD